MRRMIIVALLCALSYAQTEEECDDAYGIFVENGMCEGIELVVNTDYTAEQCAGLAQSMGSEYFAYRADRGRCDVPANPVEGATGCVATDEDLPLWVIYKTTCGGAVLPVTIENPIPEGGCSVSDDCGLTEFCWEGTCQDTTDSDVCTRYQDVATDDGWEWICDDLYADGNFRCLRPSCTDSGLDCELIRIGIFMKCNYETRHIDGMDGIPQTCAEVYSAEYGYTGFISYRNEKCLFSTNCPDPFATPSEGEGLPWELYTYACGDATTSAPFSCSDITEPCDCTADLGCGWSSSSGTCLDSSSSTTNCVECHSLDTCVVPGECSTYGCGNFDDTQVCSCDADCDVFGNCCPDYEPECVIECTVSDDCNDTEFCWGGKCEDTSDRTVCETYNSVPTDDGWTWSCDHLYDDENFMCEKPDCSTTEAPFQCSDISDPCACSGDLGCGWSSSMNMCTDSSESTTNCIECSTLDSCVHGGCAVYGCGMFDDSQTCGCDGGCDEYGNCCSDYEEVCQEEAVVMVPGPCVGHDYSGDDMCTDDNDVLSTISGTYERCWRACADDSACTHMTMTVMSEDLVWCTLLSGEYSPGNDWSYMPSYEYMGEGTCCVSKDYMHTYMDMCDRAGCSVNKTLSDFPGGTITIEVQGDLDSEGEMAYVYINGKFVGYCGELSCEYSTVCGEYNVDHGDVDIRVVTTPSVNACPLDMTLTMSYGTSVSDDGCAYVAATSCPEEVEERCSSEIPDCYSPLESGQMCTADTVLPNGETEYNVQNCDGENVFVYMCEDDSSEEEPVVDEDSSEEEPVVDEDSSEEEPVVITTSDETTDALTTADDETTAAVTTAEAVTTADETTEVLTTADDETTAAVTTAEAVLEMGAALTPCKGLAADFNRTDMTNYWSGSGWYGGGGSTGTGPFGANPDANYSSGYPLRFGACEPSMKNVQCIQAKGKVNCNEALTCSSLLDIKAKLEGGGYSCFGRHEKTYWSQFNAEAFCKKKDDCTITRVGNPPTNSPSSADTQSRYLSPWGWKGSKIEAGAFERMGLRGNVATFAASPFPRCTDNNAHFAGSTSNMNATVGEKLMYVHLKENFLRKGLCEHDDTVITDGGYMMIFDDLRKLAGTKPPAGKNNFYTTHGTVMKGAFGEQIDEGYWMCLKATDEPFPSPKQHTWPVCTTPSGDIKSATVDFGGAFKFGMETILSSESFSLMETCVEMQAAAMIATQGSLLALAGSDLRLSSSDLPTAAFTKLKALQAEALESVFHAQIDKPDEVHLGVFVHNNGGYREPASVHLPFRRILEDTIGDWKSMGGSRFAIIQAVITHSDASINWGCAAKEPSHATFKALNECYQTKFNSGNGDYWGGKEKATINVDTSFSSTSIYDVAEPFFGNRAWFAKDYTSPYVPAAACLVDEGKLTLNTMLSSMGCEVCSDSGCQSNDHCEDVNNPYCVIPEGAEEGVCGPTLPDEEPRCHCPNGTPGDDCAVDLELKCDECFTGWTGIDCTTPIPCTCPNGTPAALCAVENDILCASCNDGWTGPQCTDPCTDINGDTCLAGKPEFTNCGWQNCEYAGARCSDPVLGASARECCPAACGVCVEEAEP